MRWSATWQDSTLDIGRDYKKFKEFTTPSRCTRCLFDLIFTHSTTKKLYPPYQVVLFQGQGGRFEAKIKGNQTCPTRAEPVIEPVCQFVDVSLDCHWRLHLLKKLKKQQVLPFHSSVLHGWCCADCTRWIRKISKRDRTILWPFHTFSPYKKNSLNSK